jgi:type I restriction enzyme R subunit
MERFMPWRTTDGSNIIENSAPQLETLINGVFEKTRFLDFVKNFIVFNSEKHGMIKKIAGYHQYFAVNKAVEATLRASRSDDKRIGVVWHTQGSGKSLTMAFFAGKIALNESMKNPTIILLTDRNDLDNQLFEEFSKCSDLFRQNPDQVHDRIELRNKLNTSSGGVIFTTIQKFVPEKDKQYPLLSNRRNIVFVVDEAHRSHYEFIHGYARHIRDALPNASFIAFTGTPVEMSDRNTPAIFGDYLDIYDIQRAVEDHFTVPIYYEARATKLKLHEEERPKIDKKFEEVTEDQEVEVREKLKSKWTTLESIVGTDNRISQVASDIVTHFEERIKILRGKAMIVCMSRRICVDLYDAIIHLRPEWHHMEDDQGVIKVIMTGSASDPIKLQPHIRNKFRTEKIKSRLKNPNDKLQFVIVRDMWLTGFDAPILHTMYIDKPMKGHSLMQAIARVNRVFRDKPGGLIVDYIGLGYFIEEALSNYTETDRKDTAIDKEQAVALMLEKYTQCKSFFNNFDYSKFFHSDIDNKLSIIPAAMEHVLKDGKGKKNFLQAVTELTKSFALSVPHAEAVKIRDELGFFQVIKSQIIKRTSIEGIPDENVNSAIRQIISESIGSQGVVDIFNILGLDKPEMTPLLSDAYLNKIRNIKQKNLAVELLQKLLNDEIKFKLRRNLSQSKLFSELIEKSLKKYQNRTIEAAEVINELIEMAKHFRESSKRGEKLNLSEDELAFYDALDTDDPMVKLMGDETLRLIAIELVQTIKQNTTIDWNLKASVQAKLRVLVKRLLRKYGYPPEKYEKVTLSIMKQAEEFTRTSQQELIIERVFDYKDKEENSIYKKIKNREDSSIERKSSFRYDINLKQSNPKLLEKIIAKTIQAFMNGEGGTLFIGIDDDGKILGLKEDYKTLKKKNSDGFELELRQSLDKYLQDKIVNELIKISFYTVEECEICEIIVKSSPKPIILSDEGKQEFYVRIGNSSKPYSFRDFYEYSIRRFKEQ